MPTISFIRDSESIDKLSDDFRESENRDKLKHFRKKLSKKHYKQWHDKHDLSTKFFLAFAELIREKPQSGWIRYETAEQNNSTQVNKLLIDNKKLIEENRTIFNKYSDIKNELEARDAVNQKVNSILKALPYKNIKIGEYEFNGIELIALFTPFIAVKGKLNGVLNSIYYYLRFETDDDVTWDYTPRIKPIIGFFISFSLVKITLIYNHNIDTTKLSHADDQEIVVQIIEPTNLLHEVYSKVQSTKIKNLTISR